VSAANAVDGQGAVFTVTLPRLAASAQALSRDREITQDPVSLAGVRVLIVDDRLDDRDVLTKMLEAAGAEVTAVASAAEGLAALERGRPHVLLSDLGMPGEDGYSLMRCVRSLPSDRGGLTPAVALTAYPDPGRRALDAGFQAHVAKPVDPAKLARAVAGLAPKAGRDTD
jgi:CheY-like chemotaxis protein